MLPPPQHHSLRLTSIQAVMERTCLCITTSKVSSLCSYMENWLRKLFQLRIKVCVCVVIIFKGFQSNQSPNPGASAIMLVPMPKNSHQKFLTTCGDNRVDEWETSYFDISLLLSL